MTGTDYEKVMLALAAFTAAGADGIDAQVAVAQTILRRAETNDNLVEILAALGGAHPDSRDPAWVLLLRKINDAYSRSTPDLSQRRQLSSPDLRGSHRRVPGPDH